MGLAELHIVGMGGTVFSPPRPALDRCVVPVQNCESAPSRRNAAKAVQKVQRRSVSRSQKTVLSSPLKPCLPAPILCGCRSGGCPWSFPLRGFRRKGTAYVGATGLGNCVQRGSSRGSLQKRPSEARVSTATPRAESVKRHHTPGCEGVRA